MDRCFVPNNLGDPIEWRSPSPAAKSCFIWKEELLGGGGSSTGSNDTSSGESTSFLAEDLGSSIVHQQPEEQGPNSSSMNSFSLSPIDFDPLPNFFSFAPCSTSYKEVFGGKEKQPQDMADVLLSLKHAVVHPGQMVHHHGQLSPLASVASGFSPYPHSPGAYVNGPQLVSPGGYTHQYPQDITFSGSVTAAPHPAGNHHHHHHHHHLHHHPGSHHHQQHHHPHHQGPQQQQSAPSVFPSMSVNVSMNMTMGVAGVGYNVAMEGTGGLHHHHHHHQDWGQSTAAAVAAATLPQGCQSSGQQVPYGTPQQPYHAPTYAFDLRPSLSEDLTIKGVGMGVEIAHRHQQQAYKRSGFARKRAVPFHQSAKGLLTSCMDISESGSQQLQTKANLCRICGKTYARPSTLKTHLRTHSGEKPYRCSECTKSFSQAANLTAHVRTHSGEKPFRCPICDRRFSQSSSVTTHMRTHSGERPYRCRMCKKAFSDSSTLTKHLRIHSGEKPYQCKLCLLRFSQSGNLNRHMRVHANNA